MAASGQVSALMNPAASPAHQEYALRLRYLCGIIPGSFASIAESVPVGRSTLSEQISAHKAPNLDVGLRLHELASAAVKDEPGHPLLQATPNELQELHGRAAIKHCVCCPEGKHKPGSAAWELAQSGEPCARSATAKPAACGVRDFRQMLQQKKRKHATRMALPQLPVPHGRGDRQSSHEENPADAAIAGLISRLKSGRGDDARSLLYYAGAEAPADSVRDAVIACREAGQDEAADVVLHHASSRPAPEVLAIARVLLVASRQRDATQLLVEAAPER